MEFETFEPEPLIEEEVKPKPKKINTFKLIIAIVVGIIIGIVIMIPLSITEDELLQSSQDAFDYGVSYGIEYSLAIITNQSIQCNQIPINYSGYEYTLYPLECLNLNENGGE